MIDPNVEEGNGVQARYCKDHAGMICNAKGFYWRSNKETTGIWVDFDGQSALYLAWMVMSGGWADFCRIHSGWIGTADSGFVANDHGESLDGQGELLSSLFWRQAYIVRRRQASCMLTN